MTETGQATGRLPTEAEETAFWALIEQAWELVGAEAQQARQALLTRDPHGDQDPYVVDPHLDVFLERLRDLSVPLTDEQLTDHDRVLERKLYDIDRVDVHEVTDGSDDGFLYARGFIVAVGRDFYRAVVANPAMAVLDGGCEAMCYFFADVYEKRNGVWPETGSGICRESNNNSAGWLG
ncbi:DUF4240 domain-containing protein [Catellatospora sp. NPDC049609]|uniref:DUF4240 domain-containing protein n=1 Tax=Catellatospora sp. NPDC049609 TaxID=3155505 RepID=UPI003439AF8D